MNADCDQDVHGGAVSANVHHVWALDNRLCRNSGDGIQLASDAGVSAGRLTRIHDSDNDCQSGSAWQNCGISLPGGVDRFVLENSLHDVDSGVCVPYDYGKLYLFDNLIEMSGRTDTTRRSIRRSWRVRRWWRATCSPPSFASASAASTRLTTSDLSHENRFHG